MYCTRQRTAENADLPDLTTVRTKQVAEHGRRAAAGFTLLELLLVIAIIAILTSILFPVFTQARDKARQTGSIFNMKQIGLAFAMYAQDYDETLPPLFYNDTTARSTPDNLGAWRWPLILQTYTKSIPLFKSPGDTREYSGALCGGGGCRDPKNGFYGYLWGCSRPTATTGGTLHPRRPMRPPSHPAQPLIQ